jgi:hypothetical protein
MEDLGNKGQQGLTCDIFEIYYKEHVQKSRGSEEDTAKVEDQYLFDLCKIVAQFGERQRIIDTLNSVV